MKVGQVEGTAASSAWEVRDEQIGLPTPPGEVGAGLRVQEPVHWTIFWDRLVLAHAADQPACRAVYTALTQMLFYNIHPRTIEDVATFEPGQFLTPDGSNLASVFFRLGCPPNEVAERINEYLPLILPGLAKVRAETVLKSQPEFLLEGQKVALLFEQQVTSR